jgi:penicillin-binding protein 1A
MYKRRSSIPTFFLYANAILIVVACAVLGFVGGAVGRLHSLLPEQIQQRGFLPALATEIYSTDRHPDGTVTHTLLARVYKENREYTPLSKIPQQLTEATVAIEDRRFYVHRGISPRDMLRAAVIDAMGGHVQQGGSTLTQQLARGIWLSNARTWDRKLKEVLLALELERVFSKDEIMEMYLNEVYYGHGAYGVRTAAQTYFGKTPEELSLAECALLAGLPQRPTGYDPVVNPKLAKARRHDVLEAMTRERYITTAQMKEAHKARLVSITANSTPPGVDISRAPHFSHLVIRQLVDWYGVDQVYGGGLRVYTSLDINVQKAAQNCLDQGVQDLRDRGAIRGGLVGQGALACVDVHDGRVLAMAGGVGPYDKVQFNRAYPGPPYYGRQPGSSFKPYVWCTALENGFGPDSTFSADPLPPMPGAGGKPWSPKNFSPRQSGDYTLRDALADSVNLVSVRVMKTVGVDKVRELASRVMNIPQSRLDPYISLALGVSSLSPLEQASGYAAFASGGLRYDRCMILQVDDYWGQAVYRASLVPTRVVTPEVANSMVSMLGSVVEFGTGRAAQDAGYPAGGKTGTTQDGRDAWWVGFTPDLSAAVWVGNDDYTPCPEATGAGFCAPIWAKFMHQAMQNLGYNGKFPEGAGVVASHHRDKTTKAKPGTRVVTICTDSGGLAGPYCPHTKEITLGPNDPTPGPCTIHGPPGFRSGSAHKPRTPVASRSAHGRTVTVLICTDSGKLAGPYCPHTEERTYPAGQEPHEVCPIHKAPGRR